MIKYFIVLKNNSSESIEQEVKNISVDNEYLHFDAEFENIKDDFNVKSVLICRKVYYPYLKSYSDIEYVSVHKFNYDKVLACKGIKLSAGIPLKLLFEIGG